ncbi:MAG TPA: sulfite exporter TauE/SafE family protein [Planctomycetes bacterium]|nr:sulfite exporter TauE/SafE family protein [Planctomycetota bacterium]
MFLQIATQTVLQDIVNNASLGAVGSVHCAGMCGPLAGCFMGSKKGVISYHSARLISYTLVGAMAGTLGALLGTAKVTGQGPWISLGIVFFLLLYAFGLEKYLGKIPGLAKVLGGWSQKTLHWSPAARAGALGALTPLLPCGLLYAAYGAALATGTPLRGALSMGVFAAASLPLLAASHLFLGSIHQRLGPRGMLLLQRGAMLCAAFILAWRSYKELTGASCCGG